MNAVSGLLSAATAEAIPRDLQLRARHLRAQQYAGAIGLPISISPGPGPISSCASAPRASRTYLEALQVRPEERVLMCLLDSIDWPTVFLGTLYAGRVAVPVNTLMTEDDYRYMLEDSRARVLVVSQELYPKFANLIGTVYGLQVIVSGAEPARPSAARRPAQERGRQPGLSRRRRPRATTSRSGSTPRARPASQRRRCMSMPICG